MRRTVGASALALLLSAGVVTATPAAAAEAIDTSALRDALTVAGVMEHQQAL